MKPLFYILILISIFSPLGAASAKIDDVSGCFQAPSGTDRDKVVIPAEKLLEERQFIDSLYAEKSRLTLNLQSKETELSNLKNSKDTTVDGVEKLTSEIKDLSAKIANLNVKIEEAVQKCGATTANLDDTKRKLNELLGSGAVPSMYTPISPLPFGDTRQGGAIDIANLVSDGFKFAVGIAALLSVIMIIVHSLGYILSKDSFSGKKFSTEKIQDSLIGFLIILCSIVILRTIDPNIINLNFNISEPGLNNVNGSSAEKALIEKSNAEQQKILNGLSSVGGDKTGTGSGTPTGTNTSTGTNGSQNKYVPLDNNGKPTGPQVGRPTGGSSNQPPVAVIFCYTFKRKSDDVLQKKCISGFEACVTDKKLMKKNPALYKFTQCKINLKP